MPEMTICPVCRNTVEHDASECAHCGFKLVGSTQEFTAQDSGSVPFDAVVRCGRPHFTVTKGPMAGEVFHLDPLPVVIGRDPSCDLFLNNTTVSRRHAIVEESGHAVVLRDTGSLNGTWVNGKVVEKAELVEGSIVQVGTFTMRYSLL
ncbi:MAG: FHA domain-containing protein [Coriobacteriales bacterium]|nr:FHA domain-containing protein [Coriobacteriales bacterium]